MAAATTARTRSTVGRTWPNAICQAAVIATALYWTNVASATLECLIASNQVNCAPQMPMVAMAISRTVCPRGQAGRNTASSISPPAAIRTPTSQPGSMP